MSRGVLMYAHNNSEIDYFKIACANALMVKKNLNVPVTIVTDEGTVGWGKKALGEEFVNSCFDNIVLVDKKHNYENSRAYNDTSFSTKSLQFYNCNHWEAYDLTPYDETLFIDSDYLIMSNALNNCWGSYDDVMINKHIFNPGTPTAPYTRTIDDFGIKLYWATVIYFKKTEFSKFLFSIVKHIQDNYIYYRELYSLPNGMFRNDFAFSIAIHMLNGFSEAESVINELPISGLLMSWDNNDILAVNGINDITLYCEKEEKGKYTLARLKKQDVHIMNKWSVGRVADRLIELYK
jgi:hypothetical protein